MSKQTLEIDASLVNPMDKTEVNVIAGLIGVGTTDRLSTGQRIKWGADWLRAHAEEFIAKPVNIRLDSRGKATSHTREKVVGAIKTAHFDEQKQALMVTASIWPHYNPETVQKIKELYDQKDLHVSMEMKYPEGALQANEDGTYTPTAGTFSGMSFVGKPGDPRSMVYLMAALEDEDKTDRETLVADIVKDIGAKIASAFASKEPEEPEFDAEAQNDKNAELAAAHAGSYEWLGRALQAHLSAGQDTDAPAYQYVLATYPNYAIYQNGADYFRIDYKRSGDQLNFGEPQAVDPVYQPTAKASAEASGDDPADNTGNPNQGENDTMSATPEELLAAKDEQMAELKAAFAEVSTNLKNVLDAQAAKEADEKATKTADERLAELDTINPIKDEKVKSALHANLKIVDDAGYEALKSAFAASAELRAGIAPTETIANPNEPGTKTNGQSVPEADMKALQAEAEAQFPTGAKNGE
jgi:hypothetical protein